MVQSEFGKNIGFSLRTFRFVVAGGEADEQEHIISCNVHLEPAADVPSTQPDDCTCYSEAQCTVQGR